MTSDHVLRTSLQGKANMSCMQNSSGEAASLPSFPLPWRLLWNNNVESMLILLWLLTSPVYCFFNLWNYEFFHLVLDTLSLEGTCCNVSNTLWSLLLLIELLKNIKVFSQNWPLDAAPQMYPLLCVANRSEVVFGVAWRTPVTALLFWEEVSQGPLELVTEQ